MGFINKLFIKSSGGVSSFSPYCLNKIASARMGLHSENSFRSRNVSQPIKEKNLMCTPIRHVGLGIDDPVFNAPLAFHSSQLSTSMLTEAIKSGSNVDLDNYEAESKQ